MNAKQIRDWTISSQAPKYFWEERYGEGSETIEQVSFWNNLVEYIQVDGSGTKFYGT